MQYKKPEIANRIISFVNEYYDNNGSTPSVREIAGGIGTAFSTVSRYLSYLRDEGFIDYDGHRNIITEQMQNDLMNMTRTRVSVPVVGRVACGALRDAEEHIEETVKLPISIFGDGPLFILCASGNSMVDAGIDDGDYVVVRQQRFASPGQIVVAETDGETTLKGYFPEPDKRRIRLQPANREMKPIYVKEVNIQGVAVKVIKNIGRIIG